MEIAPVRDDGSAGQPITIAEEIVDVAPGKLPAVNSTIPANPITLFEGKVLLHFAQSQEEVHHDFFAIHSGGANIKLAFTFNGKPNSFSFPVLVTNCVTDKDCTPRLGKNNFDFDDLFMTFADRHGIPPQLLKAQVAQESGFKPKAYRYEPLSEDFGRTAAPLPNAEQRKKNITPTPFGKLQEKAFAPWALAQSHDCSTVSVPAGGNIVLSGPDVTPRQRFGVFVSNGNPICRVMKVPDSPTVRAIAPSDALVSMENILYTNDACFLNGLCTGWTTINANSFVRFSDYQVDHPPFTGQTVIASSYGLHQLLYGTAVKMGYVKNGVGLPPNQLFVPSTSLDLGSRFLAIIYADKKMLQDIDFSDTKQFLFQFGPVLRRFNGPPMLSFVEIFGTCGNRAYVRDPDAPEFDYPCLILPNSKNFTPSPLGGTQ